MPGTPDLWRVALVTLFLALVGNVALWPLTGWDEQWFATTIAIGSGVAAVGLLVSRYWERSLLGYALLLSLAVWVANAFEYATQSGANGWNQIRQCLFYVSFAVLSLGTYVATRNTNER